MKNINIPLSLIAAVISMATANIANATGLITITNPGTDKHTIEADGGCEAIENGPCIDTGDTGYTTFYGNTPTLEVKAGRYLFTYIGDGDASYHNQFWLNSKLMFDNKSTAHLSNVDLKLTAGPVKFKYVFDIENNSGHCPSGGCVLTNGTSSNWGAYFLGMHGSLSIASPATSEKEAWIGLTDRDDHDFQDLGVRVTSLDTQIDCKKHVKKHHHKSKKSHHDHNDGGHNDSGHNDGGIDEARYY